MTIQTKATEQYFSVVLFITLNTVVCTLKFVGEILKCHIQMTATEWYVPVGLLIMMYKLA